MKRTMNSRTQEHKGDPRAAASVGLLAKLAPILFCFALGISLYLAWQSAVGNAIPGCGPESGCGKIVTSRWSRVWGLPVSWLGAGAYITLLVSSLGGGTAVPWIRRIECAASMLVIGGAIWFTIVQAVILKAFCPWCCTAHALACIGVMVLWRSRNMTPDNTPAARPGLAFFTLPVGAIVGMAILQSWQPEREKTKEQTVGHSLVSDSAGISLYAGRITLDPSELPAIGLPGGPLNAVAITDFTCPHCRELHQTLSRLANQRPGQFNVVLLPGALEPEAREIHRIMLSLWRMDRERHQALNEELMSGMVEPKVAEVLGWIQKRMDGKFYELSWPHADWVQVTLRQAEDLLELNRQQAGASTLPQFMIRDRVITGAPHLETLVAMIDASPEAIAASPPAIPDPVPMAGPASATSAVISVESTTIDLGTVTKGDFATKTITFTNSGSSPLHISNIKAGCGCTTIQGWEKTVAPGKQGSFEVKLDTARFSGAVTKTVTIESDATNGMMRLNLTANIWSPVRLSRPTISFGPVIKGKPVEPLFIDITVTEPEPLHIAGASSLNPYFHAEMKVVEDGRRYQMKVSVPEMGERPQSGEVVLALGHPRLKELKLPATISPVDPLMVQPLRLNVSAGTLKAAQSTSITVFCHDPTVTELKVTDLVYSGEDDVGLAFDRQGSNRWGRVVLTFPEGFSWRAGKTASVGFSTNHPEYPRISIPVHFIGPPPEAALPATSSTR